MDGLSEWRPVNLQRHCTARANGPTARSGFSRNSPANGTPAALNPVDDCLNFNQEGQAMTLTLVDLLILLLIAGVCGALGQFISGEHRGGILVSIALGFIGALLGVWIARAMNLPEPFPIQVGEPGTVFPVVWSIAGSTLFLVVLGLLRRPFYRHDID
jgi:uncharacterized membrane protein YeaQ/YmgE (transglycosylase-associated protein family)